MRFKFLACAAPVIAILLTVAIHAEEEAVRTPGVETPGIEQTVLIDAPLVQFPGKRVRVFTGEFEPGAKTPLHRHPGTEFLYVLDGMGTMVLPGREPEELAPGRMVLVEPKPGEDSFTHQAINLNPSEGMKTLVIVIHDEGTPPALPLRDQPE